MSFDPRINSFRIRQYTLLLGEMTNDVHCLALNACIKIFLNQVHEAKYKLYIYFFFLHSKKKKVHLSGCAEVSFDVFCRCDEAEMKTPCSCSIRTVCNSARAQLCGENILFGLKTLPQTLTVCLIVCPHVLI